MNTQTTPKPSLSAQTPGESESLAQLRIVERSARAIQRQAMGWMVGAALGFVASRVAPVSLAALTQVVGWACLGMVVFCAGRWSQSHRVQAWLRARVEDLPQDWSNIPGPSIGFPVRAYGSVDEAANRGWRFGPAAGLFGGTGIPQWADLNGQRFEFDGLAPPHGMPSVPEDIRLFGRLRYRVPRAASAPA